LGRGSQIKPSINPKKEFFMKTNEGSVDRIVRVIAGLALLGLMAMGTIGVWGWLGVVLLATGAIGWCPAYTVLGMNTCAMKE
jgi:hypothetical protein